MIRARRAPGGLVLPVLLLLAAACGGGEGEARPEGAADTTTLEGASLVVGSSLGDWSLLSLPRDGGTARARSSRDLSRVIWEGETRLPAADEIRLLEGPLVVLRTEAGAVYRYDPRSDSLARVGEVPDGARWSAWGGNGVYAEPETSELLEIGPDGAWRYRVAGRPRWAGPLEGGRIAALVASSGEEGRSPSLWMLARGQNEPVARADAGYAPPALVTAWGKRLAAVDPAGEVLQFVTVPDLTRSDGVDLGGPVRELVASPSSHELYAGVGAPPRLLRINRFSADARQMVSLERDIREIRPAVLGGSLLVHDGGSPLWVPLTGGPARRLEGEWRSDLPVGTPDGKVLLVTGDGVRTWEPEEGGQGRSLDLPTDRWFGYVRWNPSPPTVVSGRVEDRAPAEPGDGERLPADTGATGEDVPTGAPAPDSAAPPATEPPGPGRAAVTAGHYAVVAAARDSTGVRRLLDRLGESGWPTVMQEHRDDAGDLWFRGMVGPYGSRAEAEAAARQLRRERDVSVWVTEIRAGTTAGEILQ